MTRRPHAATTVAALAFALTAGCWSGGCDEKSAPTSSGSRPAAGSAPASTTTAPSAAPQPAESAPDVDPTGLSAARVVTALQKAGLAAANPRRDDCRAIPPGMADGCQEIVRADTVTVWRFDREQAARHYLLDILGAAHGTHDGSYVVEYDNVPANLRNAYAAALAKTVD